MTGDVPTDALLGNVVAFGRALRGEGLAAGPSRVRTAAEALSAVDLTVRDEVYWALRASLVSRHEEIAAFDEVFATFWDRPPGGEADVANLPEAGAGAGAGDQAGAAEEAADEDERAAGDADDDIRHGLAWSADERLAELDFRAYGPDELSRARLLVGRIAITAPRRRSRRLEAARSGRAIDHRRTLRRSIATGGHPLERSWRRPRNVVRKLTFLVDVSGSMEPYARVLMMFLHAAVRADRKVEAFSFGTRLTRLTPHMTERDPDAALRSAARAVPDWAGGTRIGENLRAFNERWGRRGVIRGATVVVASDGWERGDVRLLADQLALIRRCAHRVVWVNPLAGDPDYEPLAAGMAAALPFVDVFLPGHNLRSLETLADVLASLPERRGRTAGRVAMYDELPYPSRA